MKRFAAGDLWIKVRHRFGVDLPWKSFTPGHSTPLAFLHDAWRHAGDDVAAWACRSGGKTLTASILAALEFLEYDHLQARVLAGSEDQARNLYEYWRNWCDGPLARRVQGRILQMGTRVAGGRMQILAASQRRVRGGKVQRLFEDELDEVPLDIDAAAVGMLAGRNGIPARTVYTSTWHRAGGAMGRLVDSAAARGIRLHRWNVWEAIQRCSPERHDNGRGCGNCPLAEPCLAKARQVNGPGAHVGIAADGTGLYPVQDVCKAFRKVSLPVWQAEYECLRPSVQGLVYPQFDQAVHVRAAAPAPEALEIFRSVDWGFGVFVCLWLGVDVGDVVWLLDTCKTEHATLSDNARRLLEHPLRTVRATYCDPAGRNRNDQTGRSNVETFRAAGIPCTFTLEPRAREVANGIRLVRELLAPASGPPRLYVVDTPANRSFIRDIHDYRNRRVNDVYVDEPVKPQPADHTMDALRYFVVNRLHGHRPATVRLGAR